MKTSLFYINILGLFFFFNQQLFAQTITYGSGTMTNNATTPAGMSGAYSTFIGNGAGNSNTTAGLYNSAFGSNTLYSNTAGDYNTALGYFALNSSVYGNRGTAVGTFSQRYANSTASSWVNYNVSVGYEALRGSTTSADNTGNYNSTLGYQSLMSNTSGEKNVACGYQSLYSNTSGAFNIAHGSLALYSNTTGEANIAIGQNSLYTNTAGKDNTAIGYYSLQVSTGDNNTANGYYSQYSNTTGYYNTSLGYAALYSNTVGYNNAAFGTWADVGSNNLYGATAIGYNATTNANNRIYIGTSANSENVGGYDGWQQFSDRKFKHNISEDVPGVLFIKMLRPVSYNVKVEEYDMFLGIKQRMDTLQDLELRNRYYQKLEEVSQEKRTGFIAQEVDSVANLLGYDFDGVHVPVNDNDNYTICYSSFVVPLVKAVQELSKTIDSLKNYQVITDSLLLAIQNSSLNSGKNLLNTNLVEQGKAETTIQVELSSNSQPFLYQNEPNPFSENTIIRYYVPENITSNVYIVFYDMYGKEIKRVDIVTKGFGKIEAGTGNLATGFYSYSLIVNDILIDTKKMMKKK